MQDLRQAVDDISFQVYAGEIFGLLGPNGAGKSTTLRTIITLLHPTSGSVSVLGHDTVREADLVRTLFGYVPQERAIDRFLTGREHLELLGALYHLTKDEAAKRIAELLKLVELEAHADRPAKTYSGGMKRKLDIACGLLPNPKILFLDEPTLGLDVQSRLRIWDYIRMLKARGMTVVMTTNYLDEADQLCDRLAIIDCGKVKTIGSPAELKVALGGDIVSLTIKEKVVTAFIGPSGCGKSTLLRMVAGLETITSGTIAIGGFIEPMGSSGLKFRHKSSPSASSAPASPNSDRVTPSPRRRATRP